MFESCCSPHESAHLLRARYGLPVEMFANRPFLSVGPMLEAITLPAGLGRRVLERLRVGRELLERAEQLPRPPVIADPRGRRWTLLTAPPAPYHPLPQQLLRRLHAHAVELPEPGTRIMLPTTDLPLGWHWASEPEPGTMRLPHRTVALGAVRLSILAGADNVPA
ncbi:MULTISPECIES: hypothetical protein [unclassified Nocardia]|uniref:hypothetical protein n=1 Tax=unclassified Nocardia TaxID=2637762 RepID=UPI0035D9A365